MDPVEANFIITVIGVAVGAFATMIGALGKCFLKSRCSTIKTPCISCERDLLPADADIYKDAQDKI